MNSKFQQAGETKRVSLAGEFVSFMMNNKKWWLLPILIILAIVGLLSFVAGSGVGPFVYTIF